MGGALAAIIISINIGSFYSSASKDWVEIKNDSNQEVNIQNYKLEDTTGDMYLWDSQTYIPANASCVVDVKNRLNNKGDTIFLTSNSGDQLDCKKYGDGNGGECANLAESASDDKPTSSCQQKTPEPTPTTTQTPIQTTSPSTPTPAPTVHLTAYPKPSKTPQVLAVKTANATSTMEATVEASAVPEEETKRGINPASILLLALGGVGVVSSGAYMAYKEYNDRKLIN